MRLRHFPHDGVDGVEMPVAETILHVNGNFQRVQVFHDILFMH